MSRAEFEAWVCSANSPIRAGTEWTHRDVLLAEQAWQAATERAATLAEGFDSCDPKYIAAAIRGAAQG